MGMEYTDDRPYLNGWSLEVVAGIVGIVFVVAVGNWLAARPDAPPAEAGAPKP